MKFLLFVNSECTLKFNTNTDNFLKAFFYILDPGEMKTHSMYLNRTQQRNYKLYILQRTLFYEYKTQQFI